MKTEKQILLKKEEVAAEIMAKSTDMDKIIVPVEAYDRFLNWTRSEAKQLEKINIIPLLKSGYIKLEIKGLEFVEDYDTYYIFRCDSYTDAELLINVDFLTYKNSVYRWNYSAKIQLSALQNPNGDNFDCVDYVDATCLIYQKQKRSEAEITQYVKQLPKDWLFAPVSCFLGVNGWLNYIMEHPEVKEVQRKEGLPVTQKPSGSTTPKKTMPSDITNIVVNGVRFVTKNKKLTGKLTSRKYQRIAESWQVRGHYRKYSNGKVVYIAPYSKGEGAKKVKEYKVQE